MTSRYESLMDVVRSRMTIASWDRFDPANLMTDEEIDEWVKTTRHKVMYRDESRVD